MTEYQRGSHTLHDIKYHRVWITKYRYQVLRGAVAERARDVIREICMAREVQVIRGSLSPGHVHMLVSCPPKLVQAIKGRSSRKLQQEFSEYALSTQSMATLAASSAGV
jgi:putative transposase